MTSIDSQRIEPQVESKSWQAQFRNPETAEQRKLKQSAQEFEGILLQQVFAAMDKTVDRENSLTGNSQAETMFRGMFFENITKQWATQPGGSGSGLAEQIYRQMSVTLGDA